MSKPIIVVGWGQSNQPGTNGRETFIDTDRLNGEQIYCMSWGIQEYNLIPVPPEGTFYPMEFPIQCLGMSNITGVSGSMNFCKRLATKYPDRPIFYIECAVPGIGFGEENPYYTWNRHTENNKRNLVMRMVNAINKYSPTGSIDYLIGIQGEADAQNAMYQYQVLDMHQYMRSLYGDFVFSMGTMLLSWITSVDTPILSDATHRAIGHLVPFASTSFHDHLIDAFDNVHFSTKSQRDIGNCIYDNINRNVHPYMDERWSSLFGQSLFWYDFSRQNSNHGYMGHNSNCFWDRITGQWNTNTTGVKIDSHNCTWTTDDHLNTEMEASTLTNYTKIVMFKPSGSISFGNIMSGSINSVLWVFNGTIAALVGGQTYVVPAEQLTLNIDGMYLVVLSVSPDQVIFKVHNFNDPTKIISVAIPVVAEHKYTEEDKSVPIHIGNIPKTEDTNDGSEWYGFNGEIFFGAMLPNNLNDWDCKNAIDFFTTYWT
jgi:hypothetical protein